MVDIVPVGDVPGKAVHIVNGGEDIVDNDVLGNQLILVELDLLFQLFAGILAQQLLKHIVAHPLLDLALSQGIKVHKVAQIAHLVGNDPDRIAVRLNGHLADAAGIQALGLVSGEQVPLFKEDLAGGRVSHGINQLIAGDPGPQAQLFIELIAAHDGQIVAPGVEEQVVHQRLAGFHRGRLAGTELPVDLQHRVFIGLAGVLLKGRQNPGIISEPLGDLRVGLQPQRPQQAGDGEFPVFINANPEALVGVRLILQPSAAIGNHRGREDGQIGLQVDLLAVIHAGGTDDLRHHYALRAIDDESAGMGHQGEVPHEDLLFLNLLRLLVAKTHGHLQRRRVGRVPRLALLHVVLGVLVHLIVDERQLQISLIVGNRTHIGEDLPQSLFPEPLIGFLLDLQQVRHGHNFLVPGKVLTKAFSVILVFGHL